MRWGGLWRRVVAWLQSGWKSRKKWVVSAERVTAGVVGGYGRGLVGRVTSWGSKNLTIAVTSAKPPPNRLRRRDLREVRAIATGRLKAIPASLAPPYRPASWSSLVIRAGSLGDSPCAGSGVKKILFPAFDA